MFNSEGRVERKDELLRTALMLGRGGADDDTLLEWYHGLPQDEQEQLLDSLGKIIAAALNGLGVIAGQVSEASEKANRIFEQIGAQLFEVMGGIEADGSELDASLLEVKEAGDDTD